MSLPEYQIIFENFFGYNPFLLASTKLFIINQDLLNQEYIKGPILFFFFKEQAIIHTINISDGFGAYFELSYDFYGVDKYDSLFFLNLNSSNFSINDNASLFYDFFFFNFFDYFKIEIKELTFSDFKEFFRYYLFFFGFIFIDLNINLISVYAYLFKWLHFLWPPSFDIIFYYLCMYLYAFLSVYSFTYNVLNLLALFFLFFIISIITAIHLFFVLYVIKMFLVYLNLIGTVYRLLKFLFFSFLWFFIVIYFFFFNILARFFFFIRKFSSKKKKISAKWQWFKVKMYYFAFWAYEIWGEGTVDPFGGMVDSTKKYLWAFPSWIYFSEIVYINWIMLGKAKTLNIWSRVKLLHKKNLGLNERKWWYYITSWNLLYTLRYYYYFLSFFLIGKIFRLIYFFFVFSFKYIFFLLLKYILGFGFANNIIQIFFFYYIHILAYSRKLVSVSFYNFILYLYAYLKTKIICFFTLDMHYLLYKYILLFDPKNTSFIHPEYLNQYPFDVSLTNLKRFFWFQCNNRLAYDGYSLTFVLKCQVILLYCSWIIVTIIFDKLIEGVIKIPLSVVAYFHSIGIYFREDHLQRLRILSLFFYFFFERIKLSFFREMLLWKGIVRAKSFTIWVLCIIFTMLLILLVLFLIINFAKLITIMAVSWISFLTSSVKIYILSKVISLTVLYHFFEFWIIYFNLLAFSLFFYKLWKNIEILSPYISIFFDFLLWYLGFFVYFIYSFIVFLFSFIIKKIIEFKIWAWFLLILLLSFDETFFYYYFIQPFLDFASFCVKNYTDFVFWSMPILDLGAGKSANYSMAQWLALNRSWHRFYGPIERESTEYINLVMSYSTYGYWVREKELIKTFLEVAMADKIYFIHVFLLTQLFFEGDFGTFESAVNFVQLPTFHKIPKNMIKCIYFFIKKIIIGHFMYLNIYSLKDMIIFDLALMLRAYFIKIYFDWYWFFQADIPIFLGFFMDNSSYYNFLNNFLGDKIFGYLIFIVRKITYYLVEFLSCLYLVYWYKAVEAFIFAWFYIFYWCKCIVIFTHEVLAYFNWSFFLTEGMRNIEMYWFKKSQNILNFKDVYEYSLFRVNGYKFYKNLKDKHYDDFFPWFRMLEEHGGYYEAWLADEFDEFQLTAMGHYNPYWNITQFNMYKINNWLYHGFSEELYIKEPLPALAFLYRSILIYLHFSLFFLTFIFYIFFVYILQPYKSDYLNYSKPHLWTCLREGTVLPEDEWGWINTFNFLDFFHSRGEWLNKWEYDKNKVEQGEKLGKKKGLILSKSTIYYYAFFRYYLILVRLFTKIGANPKRSLRCKYGFLRFHEKRLRKKLANLTFIYLKKLNLLKKPLDYKKFFYAKGFNNYFSLWGKYKWVFEKFSEYKKKKKNIFSNFLDYTYMGPMPLTGIKLEDALDIQNRLHTLFNFFWCVDKGFLMGRGPIFMLHKDPSSDFITYDLEEETVYQNLENPHCYHFDLDLIIWELPFSIIVHMVYWSYVHVLPGFELENDEWSYFHFWVLSFFENFDIFHNILPFFILCNMESESGFFWEIGDTHIEDFVSDGNYPLLVPARLVMSEFFCLHEYWFQVGAHIFRNNDFDKMYYFKYYGYLLINFLYDKIFFFSIWNISSPLLLTYYAVKYFFFSLLVINYIIFKFFGFKRKKFNLYIENSASILDYLKNLKKVRIVSLDMILKKKQAYKKKLMEIKKNNI